MMNIHALKWFNYSIVLKMFDFIKNYFWPKAMNSSRMDYFNGFVRLCTFKNWPHSLFQNPFVMAEAGFYYTGKDDVAKCFSCQLELTDWECTDDPWSEHFRHNAECPYLLMVKGVDKYTRMRDFVETDFD